uniref:BED-type domain-containing protein n=1 Tax=Meloidogyne floridensis TaxID=298350 RepID=A0A915NZB1_9BILA
MLQQPNIFLPDTIQQQLQQQRQQSPPILQTIRRQQHQPQVKTQQLPNGDSRVIRSEVWNCFDLDGLNAVCRACNERLKVGPTRQTSSLWRHLKRHSREVQDRLVKSWAEAGLSNKNANRIVARIQNGGTPTNLIEQRKRELQQQQQQYSSSFNSSTATNFTSSSSTCIQNDTEGPLVTSLDLEQLLGLQQNSNDGAAINEGEISPSNKILEGLDNNEIDEMDFEVEEEEEPIKAARSEKVQENFERAVVEFLLVSLLMYWTLLLMQSPAFGEVLRLFSSSPTFSTNLFRPIIPSPEPLLTRLVPKMFIETLDERKALFEEDFFVLVLRRTKIENAPKGNTCILRISAVKLSESFGLCSRCLGVFAYRGGLRRLRDALRKCFEEGSVQLKLWQVSAVVHDGSPEFEELCEQLDIPGILSAPLMLRSIFNELDKLQFSSVCVRRVKNKFEQTIGNALDGLHFSAFSITVPILIERTNNFCNLNNVDQEEKTKEFIEEQRLIEKFKLLWNFQREKLLKEKTAKMSIFLNPNNCHNLIKGGPFNFEEWKKVETLIIEEICQACLPLKNNNEGGNGNNLNEKCGGENEEGEFKQRIEIEAEVNSYVEASLNELRKKEELDNQQQQHQSLSELLLWWRTNIERFPRVGHLARQFCAIPLCVENGEINIFKELNKNNNELKNANYATELLNTDLAGERDDYSADMLIVSQLLTVRIAVIEKNNNGCGGK